MKVWVAQLSGALIAGGGVAAAAIQPGFMVLVMIGVIAGFAAHSID